MLVTGIANPQPLIDYLKSRHNVVAYLTFPDHHNFSETDIGDILETYHSSSLHNYTILTTEKDAMRLREWPKLAAIPVFALPIAHRILFGEKVILRKVYTKYLKTYKKYN
ncbi:tetraacyldisaccharide 4'-kinase [Niabella ginsengisoli]|uniref:tetraacyldisaccharide 4'-kinase n=1 Tax=Niabella ginsengisoli TaxID=522298 RepID=UPI00293F53DD|nr:tetraacyldisaccharide 4'-kinase [Niabella ginsengisoli]